MAGALDHLDELIRKGESFTYENFSTKSGFGYPNGFSSDWLVWTHHVEEIRGEISSLRIGNVIRDGLNVDLLGEGPNNFAQAQSMIINALKAAQQIYGKSIPAADRIVSLGHNSREQKQGIEKVDAVIEAVTQANDLDIESDEKEQILAELSAARRLLEASKVRLSALAANLQPSLRWIIEKAAGSIVGKVASAAYDFFVSLHWFL